MDPISQILQNLEPAFRQAIQTIVEGHAMNAITFQLGIAPNGISQRMVVVFAAEMPGTILLGTVKGIDDSLKRANEIQAELQQQNGSSRLIVPNTS